MNRLIAIIYRQMRLIVILSIMIVVLAFVIMFKKPAIIVTRVAPGPKAIVLNLTGERLFNNSCSTCHHLFRTHGDLFIRGLERLEEERLLDGFIRYPEAAVSQSKYLQRLQENYGGAKHPGYPGLTFSQIDSIVDYVKGVKLTWMR